MSFPILAAIIFIALLAIGALVKLAMDAKSARLSKRIRDAGYSDAVGAGKKKNAQAVLIDTANTQMDDVFKYLGQDSTNLKNKLKKANLQMSPLEFMVLHILLIAAFCLGVVFYLPSALKLYGFAAAVVLPIFLLRFWLNMKIEKRIKTFNKFFPDALELMVRGLRTGLPITECIKAVAKDTPDPVGPEFAKMRDDIRLGMTLSEAAWKSAEYLGAFSGYSIGNRGKLGGKFRKISGCVTQPPTNFTNDSRQGL
jgi:tight adherence protein B